MPTAARYITTGTPSRARTKRGEWAGVLRPPVALRSERGLAALPADAGLAGAIILFAMVGVSAGALQAEAFVAGRHGGLAPGLAEAIECHLRLCLQPVGHGGRNARVGFAVPLRCGLGRWSGRVGSGRASPKERLTTLAMQEFPLTVTRTIRRNSRRPKSDAAPVGES